MSNASGYNPLRWKCGERGCFNEKHRAKIEIFAEDLPGRIAMTDVDATVEVNGRFLFLEFKSGDPRQLPIGQKIYFQRLTELSSRITVCVVCADAETMAVRAVCVINKGEVGGWEICSTARLKERIRAWAKRSMAQRTEKAA